MKKSYRLLAGFFLVCALCSGVVSFLMPCLNPQATSNIEDVDFYLVEDIQWLIVGKMMDMDPSYSLVECEDENLQEQMNRAIQDNVRRAAYELDNDPNFFYRVNSGQKTDERQFDEDLSIEDCLFYGVLNYDQSGNLTQEGTMSVPDFSFLSVDYIYSLYDIVYSYGFEDDSSMDLQIIPPSNLKVEIRIPKEMNEKKGTVYNCIYNESLWAPFTLVAFFAGSAVVGLYILIASYRSLSLVQPFKTLLGWKAEFNVVFLGFVTSMILLLGIYSIGLTLDGRLLPAMTRFGLPLPALWVGALNFITYFLSMVLIGMCLYYVKYALCSGPIRFLKEDSWLGGQIYKIVKDLKDQKNYDLDSKVKNLIFKAVLLNTIIVFLLSLFWGWFLALIYGVCTYLFLVKKAKELTDEYGKVLGRMDRMGQGDFSISEAEQTQILPALQERLDTLQEDFEGAIKERVRSQNMKTELITNVSHDLKTPLTGIKNYLELLNDPNLSEEEKREYLGRLDQYTDRLSKLIEDLFEVSKANSGNIELCLQPVDIVSLVEQVLVENEKLLEKAQLIPVLRKPDTPVVCELDGDKTVRIFENLISNVSKYALSNTRVFIRIEKVKNQVLITIQNISKTPLDFDPEDITERFVRADESRHEPGSGLGLAIVKSFCEVQNGKFEVCLDGDVFKGIVTFTIQE